jgi:hypothetical protein
MGRNTPRDNEGEGVWAGQGQSPPLEGREKSNPSNEKGAVRRPFGSYALGVSTLGFRLKVSMILPNRFTSAPWRFMMKYCWVTDSVLFQAQ